MKRVFAVTAMIMLLCLGSLAEADVFNLGAGLTNLETVRVGDAGNVADTVLMSWPDITNDFGAVGYAYNIGKYEVTSGQYTDFLNAKAATDTYGLYSIYMDTATYEYGCNIKRAGTAGNYTYSVASDWANRPVNMVSFWDCCRFANWLGNGQGNSDTETGAYTLTTDGMYNNTVTRNAGWKWAVTNEDEWYKAAYYKGGSTNAEYWNYPTSSDTAPGRDMADASGNNANLGGTPMPIDSDKYFTVVGEFQNSHSPYGTFDQAGNVWEWNEAFLPYDCRGMLGGSLLDNSQNAEGGLRYIAYYGPTYEGMTSGFRVVQAVPEPSSLIALGALVTPLLAFRRRRGK